MSEERLELKEVSELIRELAEAGQVILSSAEASFSDYDVKRRVMEIANELERRGREGSKQLRQTEGESRPQPIISLSEEQK